MTGWKKELNENVDAPCSDLVKKTAQTAETWVLHEHHVSVTHGQAVVEGLLLLNDFALNHADKEIPKKQPHKPKLVRDFSDEQQGAHDGSSQGTASL